MTVSTETNFDLTRTGIIRVAHQLCGVVRAGEDPSIGQLTMGTDFLNNILKALQGKGIILTTVEMVTTTLVAGQAEYTADDDTLDIDWRNPYVTDNSGNDFPLKMISRGSYDQLTNKDIEAQPTQMYVNRADPITFFLYSTPDQSWASITWPKIKLLTNMDSADVNTGLRSKYLRGIVFWLASDLAFHYGLLEKRKQLKAEFEQAVDEAVNDDNEKGAAVRFKPSYGLRWGRR